jgi:XTP/dITP diphosphohydrolase
MEIVFATSNKNKMEEVRAILPANIQLLSLEDIGFTSEIEETEHTIEGNSKLKAQTIYDQFKIPVLSEDTGLEVYALNMEPGVYSARYAGEPSNADNNMDLLLENLLKEEDRTAQFKTVATFINKNTYYSFIGVVIGNITKEKTGSGGFGYDPIFKPSGFDKVFAELSLQEKSIISHRAIAINKFAKFIKTLRSV